MSQFAICKELEVDLKMQGRDLKKFQKEIAKNDEATLKCDTQLIECELVLKELDLLKENANVYKLVGPFLVKQDPAEPKGNVRKRMDYLNTELHRIGSIIRDLGGKLNRKTDSIYQLEERLRSIELGRDERTMSFF